MSLAVKKYGNRYLGEREVTIRVAPYQTTFGRPRWRAQVLVAQRNARSDIRWSDSESYSYWPSFKDRTHAGATAKAEAWIEEARAESRAVDARLGLEEALTVEVAPNEVLPTGPTTAKAAYVADLIDISELEAAVAAELRAS